MKKFYFGYDIDNVKKVEDYVKRKFHPSLFLKKKDY